MSTNQKNNQEEKPQQNAESPPSERTPATVQKPTDRFSFQWNLTWDDLNTKRNRILLFVLTALLIGFLLTPGFSPTVKTWDDSMIGQVANKDFRSPGDYQIEDVETTDLKRKEAAGGILPIYNYETELSTLIQLRIDEAFRQMRSLITDFIIAHIVLPEEENEALNAVKETNAGVPSKEDIQKEQKLLEVKKQARLQKVRDNFDSYFQKLQQNSKLAEELSNIVMGLRNDFNRTLQAIVSEKEFKVLYRYHFSEELQINLQRMIGDVMSRKIINEKELMEKGVNGAITIHPIDGKRSTPKEYTLNDTGSILDYKEVNHSLWRYTNILSNLSTNQRELLLKLGGRLVQPNLTLNRQLWNERKEAAFASIKPMIIPIKKGEVIIRNGERFEKRHIVILKGIEEQLAQTNPFAVLAGNVFLMFAFIFAIHLFGSKNIRKFSPSFKDLLMMAVLLVLFILMVKTSAIVANALVSSLPNISITVFYLLLPIPVGAALVRIVTNSETSVMFTIVVTLIVALITTNPLLFIPYTIASSLITADAVGQVRTRTTLFFAGLRAALVGMIIVLIFRLLNDAEMSLEWLWAVSAAAGSGIATGLILTGIAPVIEFLFNYTTDIKLLELANLNHPLLKKLIVQTPGTYHHCIMVGSLVEGSAQAINANPLLARVAAYYHDIGKIEKAQYFGENQPHGPNPHDKLKPNMSVIILLSHVRKGVELSKKYNLGKKITDIIEQHHGTSLIRYFLHKAKEMEKEDKKLVVNEQDYRYPGPKPQTREAGLVMLADAVEAATRSLDSPTHERIQGIVQKVINMIFKDGQLNECELTLKDLHLIAGSFTKILAGHYHSRPAYPSSQPKGQEKQQNGRSGSQQAKKTTTSIGKVEDDDDEDLKRLGIH